jgi:phosphohistidine phosphatase
MKGENTSPMQLYLLRHGIAQKQSANGSDADRALTQDGRRKLRQVLKAASEAEVKPTLILSSALKRAMQTADIAKSVLDYKNEIVRSKALLPGASVEEVWQEIRTHKDEPALMLVGHNPQFAQLSGYLLGASEVQVEFKKGALLRIDFEQFRAQPKGTLRWYLTAKMALSRR